MYVGLLLGKRFGETSGNGSVDLYYSNDISLTTTSFPYRRCCSLHTQGLQLDNTMNEAVANLGTTQLTLFYTPLSLGVFAYRGLASHFDLIHNLT